MLRNLLCVSNLKCDFVFNNRKLIVCLGHQYQNLGIVACSIFSVFGDEPEAVFHVYQSKPGSDLRFHSFCCLCTSLESTSLSVKCIIIYK